MLEHYFPASQSEHITGKFNSHLVNTVLLFADEALFAADPRNEKVLNTMITEETRTSEQKFMPAITTWNCLHIIMATNSDWAVPATEFERRYVVLDVGDAHRQDFEYFKAIDAQMEGGGLAAMLHDLQRRDISAFEVRHIPRTAALADQQAQTLHGRGDVAGFIYGFLTSGEIAGPRSDDLVFALGAAEIEMPKPTLRGYYDAWAKHFGRRPIDPGQFGKKLKAALGTAIIERRPRKPGLAERRDDKRPEVYVLASLAECRAAYRTMLAIPELWEGGP
jgi:hypothetical protein